MPGTTTPPQPPTEAPPARRKSAFGRQVRDALLHLHDLPYLQTHPLAAALLEPSQARAANAGRLLHRRLLDAIDALQTGSGQAVASPFVRGHRLLQLRYVDGLEIPDVCDHLGLGESQYHRVHGRCLEAIVSLLEAERSEASTSASGDAAAVGTSEGPARDSGGLPYPVTPCTGRAREIDAAQRLLGSARLVTMTGPPGVGKTRLSLEVADAVSSDFPDGVFFVPLADVRSPSLVASAIARALDLREYNDRPLPEQLKWFLRDKSALLVLDNFEHVLAAAGLVTTLLTACGRLKVMVTSRAPLRVYGESECPVPPLDLPDRARLPRIPPAELAGHVGEAPAVQLFVARCRAAQPGFALTEENAFTIAEICHQLDGLPLAIELAATRVKLFPPHALLARLGRRLDLLTRGPADAPPRHQALRGAIDWSYGLLTPREQLGFRQLAAFGGGCTLEAAAAVVDLSDAAAASARLPDATRADVLDLLSALVDNGLLQVETQTRVTGRAETRFRMLETIREYGLEQLAATGELDRVRRRHSEYFLDLVERAEPRLASAAQVKWLDQLAQEHDNLREALRWTIASRVPELGLRLATGLGRFWWARGHWTEGRDWLDELLGLLDAEAGRGEDPAAGAGGVAHLRAKSLYVTGTLAWWQRDYGAARARFDNSLMIGRELGDVSTIAHALAGLGLVAWGQGDPLAARARFEESLTSRPELGDCWIIALALWLVGITHFDLADLAAARLRYAESLAIFRRLGDPWGIAQVLNSLGLLENREGNEAAARSLHDESLAIKRELHDEWGVAQSLNSLGISARGEGDYRAARSYQEEALAIWRNLGDQAGCVWSLHHLGAIALAEDDVDLADARYRECLAMSAELGDRAGTATSLGGLAAVAAGRGQPERALCLAGAAEGLRIRGGLQVTTPTRDDLARRLAVTRAMLGDVAADAALALGRGMTLQEAIAFASRGPMPAICPV